MKAIKIISIINQGGEYSVTTTYNEVGNVLEAVKQIEADAKARLEE